MYGPYEEPQLIVGFAALSLNPLERKSRLLAVPVDSILELFQDNYKFITLAFSLAESYTLQPSPAVPKFRIANNLGLKPV